MYHAESVPQSSLPGQPSGRDLKCNTIPVLIGLVYVISIILFKKPPSKIEKILIIPVGKKNLPGFSNLAGLDLRR